MPIKKGKSKEKFKNYKERRSKAQTSIQYFITFFVFIIMLVFVIIEFIVQYGTYYTHLKEKTKYQDMLIYQTRFYNLMGKEGKINNTFYNLVENCASHPYFNPSTGKINQYYTKIKKYLKMKKKEEIDIIKREYLIFLATRQININATQGTHYIPSLGKTLTFTINKSNSKKYNLLTIIFPSGGKKNIKLGDMVNIYGKEYNLTVLDSVNGKYAIFEQLFNGKDIERCGLMPQKTGVSTTIYEPKDNKIIKYIIKIW